MKIKYTLAVSMLAFLCLASCEMKDEILDKNKITGDTGFLEMGVSVQSGTTKSGGVEDGGTGTDPNAPKDANNFPVEIVQTEGGEYKKTYPTYADLQKENPIELPVGKYTVRAHTPGEIQPVMDEPYYGGQNDQLVITKGITSAAEVSCKMENTKIQITYDTEFNSTFKTWNIKITDGSSHILTFDESEPNPDPKYWLIEDNVSSIKVSIDAVTMNGVKVSESRSITKPEGVSGTEFWAGSDALNITMKPGEPTDPENPNGIGIDITVDVTFEGSEDTVEIPVDGEDGGEEPVPPVEEDKPTIKYDSNTVSYSISENNMPKEFNIHLHAPLGMESVIVKIDGGNEGFRATLSQMEIESESNPNPLTFVKGQDIVDCEALKVLFESLEVENATVPTDGYTLEYVFPIAPFFTLMNMFDPTDSGDSHDFIIEVTDKKGNKVSDKISVIINE